MITPVIGSQIHPLAAPPKGCSSKAPTSPSGYLARPTLPPVKTPPGPDDPLGGKSATLNSFGVWPLRSGRPKPAGSPGPLSDFFSALPNLEAMQ